MNNYGTFIEGIFTGYTDNEQYPQLSIRVGDPSPGNEGYCERIDFRRFNTNDGSPTMSFEPKVGDILRVKVRTKARTFTRDGQTKALVALTALEVTKLPTK